MDTPIRRLRRLRRLRRFGKEDLEKNETIRRLRRLRRLDKVAFDGGRSVGPEVLWFWIQCGSESAPSDPWALRTYRSWVSEVDPKFRSKPTLSPHAFR